MTSDFIHTSKEGIKKTLKKLHLYGLVTKLYDWMNYNIKFIQLIASIRSQTKNAEVYFFFPFSSTGGAEWIHLQIVKSINSQSVVFFTSEHTNTHYLPEFKEKTICFQIKPYLVKNFYQKKLFNRIVKQINTNNQARVFGCNNRFFYDLLPQLNKSIFKIDLTHAFTHNNEFGYEKYSLPYVHLLDKRIVISEKVKIDFTEQYTKEALSTDLLSRIYVIQNMVGIQCDTLPAKSLTSFNILYVGRNSPEKRIELMGQIASRLKSISSSIQVIFIGPDIESGVLPKNRKDVFFRGHITQSSDLKQAYENAHCVLMASTREGFPMAIMEGMMCGAVPVSTDVGGIPYHITHNENGLLVGNHSAAMIEDFVQELSDLHNDRLKYKELSANAFKYAQEQFNSDIFIKKYRELLEIKNEECL